MNFTISYVKPHMQYSNCIWSN